MLCVSAFVFIVTKWTNGRIPHRVARCPRTLSASKTTRELLRDGMHCRKPRNIVDHRSASANRISFHFTPCASVDQGHAAFPEQQAGKRPWTQLNHQAQTTQRPWTHKRMKSCLTSIYFGAHTMDDAQRLEAKQQRKRNWRKVMSLTWHVVPTDNRRE